MVEEKAMEIGYVEIALKAVKKFLIKVRNFFPSPVPQGVQEFIQWSNSIIDTYDFPNNESVTFALATMILHSGPTAAYVSKRHFAVMVKAGAAKQVASQVFTDIRQRQLDAVAAAKKAADDATEAAKQQAVAPATPAAATLDVNAIQN